MLRDCNQDLDQSEQPPSDQPSESGSNSVLPPPAPDAEQGGVDYSSDPIEDMEHLLLISSHHARKRGGDIIHLHELNTLLIHAVPSQDGTLVHFQDIAKLPTPKLHKEWMDACHTEIQSIKQCNVYDLVELPKGRKAIRCRWVFLEKSDLWKNAHLVAQGFSQVEGINFNKVFSPVVRSETVRIILATAVLEN